MNPNAAARVHHTIGSRAISSRALLMSVPKLFIVGSTPTPIGPFAHLGFELAERSHVDAIAAVAQAGGWLASPPMDLPAPIGYICMVTDPDGNTIEFSHDQGVYAFAQEHFARS